MFNSNWSYNSNGFRQQAYTQMQSQQIEVVKAVKAYKDFLDAMERLDPIHQQEALRGCFIEISKHIHRCFHPCYSIIFNGVSGLF